MKKRKILMLLIILVIFLLLASAYGISAITRNNTERLAEEKYNFEYELYDNIEEQNKVLIKISDVDGIDSITCPDENVVYCNGNTQFAMDYEVTENTEIVFNVKYKDGQSKQYTLIVDDIAKNNVLSIGNSVINEESIVDVGLLLNINAYNYNNIYYKIGEDKTDWIQYTQEVSYTSQYIYDQGYNDDTNITIYAKKTDSKGNTVIVNKKIEIPKIKRKNVLEYIMQNNIEDGIHEYTIGEVTYKFEVVNFNQDVTYSTSPTLGNDTADETMLVLKYHGNLTVGTGATITPQVRKKGMYIYVKGNLVNNGKITMDSKGSFAAGENVYLWQENTRNLYDYVEAVGSSGAGRAGVMGGSRRGNNGGSAGEGTRQTGGGASGGARQTYGTGFASGPAQSGAGGNGTSYCGGNGGAGADYRKGGYGANAVITGGRRSLDNVC